MNRLRHALAGSTLGAWVGFMLVYVPLMGAVLFVAFAIPSVIGRSSAAVAGLLVGSGGTMLLIIALANARCAGQSGDPADSCTPPDFTGWLIAGGVMAAIGLTIAAATVTASRRVGP